MWVMVKDLTNLEIADRMISLLERQIDLAEEQNDLVRENTQLLGDVLNSLDNLGNRPMVVNVGPEGQPVDLPIDVTATTKKKNTTPAPPPDSQLLDLATYGTIHVGHAELAKPYEVSHFWPSGKANPGWVRVSIKHATKESLNDRIDCGCLCGNAIVLKEHNGDSFYTCEALTRKGSCPYRPAAYFDKLTFLVNLPPAK